jgi:hypothetical protein
MTRRMLLTIVSSALVVLGASQSANAQARYDFRMEGGFVANGKTLPAGSYVVEVNVAENVLTVTPSDAKGASVLLPVETRVAEPKALVAPELVFDKLNGQLYLSELLVPGTDGYLLLATKAKHTHESLKGSPARK